MVVGQALLSGVTLLFHQSDLSALARCPAQYGYRRAGVQQSNNSASAYGSVMHTALHIYERMIHQAKIDHTPKSAEFAAKRAEALKTALETFVHYWNPMNIESICDPVPNDGWIAKQNYSEMRARGIATIKAYHDNFPYDQHAVLGLEYTFIVPVIGTWDDDLNEPHMLGGSIDRLVERPRKGKIVLSVDDFKSGKEQRYLRHNLQGTAYCFATTQIEFWQGFAGEVGFGEERGAELFERFENAERRFRWVNLRTIEYNDGGPRGPQDYQRFALAIEQLAATVKADIYPLSISGENCTYCPYRSFCGGVGLPSEEE